MSAVSELEREFWGLLEEEEQLGPAEWIEDNCILVDGPHAGAPFRFSKGYAYLREPAEVLGAPQVAGEGRREGAIMKCCQSGFTTLLFFLAAFIAVVQRKPTLILEPRDSDANRVAGEAAAAIQSSPKLAAEFPGRDAKKLRWTRKGTKIFFRFSNSFDELTGFSSQTNIYDERDRLYSGEDYSAVATAGKRQAAWPDTREISLSTPTYPKTGVDLLWRSSDQRERYLVCPYCDHPQIPAFEKNVTWKKSAGSIKLQAQSAYMHCEREEGCGRRWSRHDRIRADDRGFWKAAHPERKIPGWRLGGLAVASRDISTFVENYLKGENDEIEKKEHYNQDRGLPYLAAGSKLNRASIEVCITDRLPWGRVPKGTTRLVCGIDVQRADEPFDFVWEVRAYPAEGDPTLIAYGIASGRDAIKDVLGRSWGGTMRVGRALIDAGDGAHHDQVARDLAAEVACLSRAVFQGYKAASRELWTWGNEGLCLVNREAAVTKAMTRFPAGARAPTIEVALNPDFGAQGVWATHYTKIYRVKKILPGGDLKYTWDKSEQEGVDFPFAGALCEVAARLTPSGGWAHDGDGAAPAYGDLSGRRRPDEAPSMPRGYGRIATKGRAGWRRR